jgi:hypothetical protein
MQHRFSKVVVEKACNPPSRTGAATVRVKTRCLQCVDWIEWSDVAHCNEQHVFTVRALKTSEKGKSGGNVQSGIQKESVRTPSNDDGSQGLKALSMQHLRPFESQ